MPRTIGIFDWNPGLLHEGRTLGETVGSLPAYPPEAIPTVIRFFENPGSKWSLPGAILLSRHDAIHALLGRGLTIEDEAFVLGFTMGASDGKENRMTCLLRAAAFLRRPWEECPARKGRVRDMQVALFRWVSSHIYPRANLFSASHLTAFDLGLALGERNVVRNLEDVAFETLGSTEIGALRRRLGIDTMSLEAAYRTEALLLETPESRRLDVNDNGADNSHLKGIDGIDCDWAPP